MSRETTPMIHVTIPHLRTVNELNDHKHWRTRQRRAKHQKNVVLISFIQAAAHLRIHNLFPCRVTFTRIAPGNGLDPGDGLPSSMKHVRDQLAELIGVDDRHAGYVWVYQQRRGGKGEYAVEIQVEPLPAPRLTTRGAFTLVPPPASAAERALLEGPDIGASGGARTRGRKGEA